MSRIIAKAGRFILEGPTYIKIRGMKETPMTTHDLRLSCVLSDGCSIVMARFNESGEPQSVDTRLLDEIQSVEDLEKVRKLAEIAYIIINFTDKEVLQ